MTLESLVVALLVVCTVPSVAFVVVYGFTSRWRDSPIGRHFMAFTSVVSAFLTLAVVARIAGRPDWIMYVAVPLYVLLAFLLWRQLWLLVKVQRADRKDRDRVADHVA